MLTSTGARPLADALAPSSTHKARQITWRLGHGAWPAGMRENWRCAAFFSMETSREERVAL